MTKRNLQFALICLAALVLSACDFTIEGRIDVELDLPPNFTVSNATYATTHRAEVEGLNQFVICDNLDTILSYSFDFNGNLESWSSFLEGEKTKEIAGKASFNASQITAPGRVEVTYEIKAGGAPKLVAPDLSTQAIVVIPKPDVIGASKLFINVNGFSRSRPLSSNSIPVLRDCPTE